VQLNNLEDGSVVGSGEVRFSAVDITPQVRFTGLSSLVANNRALVELNGRLSPTHALDARVRWRLTLLRDGAPAANERLYVTSTGEDPLQHASWSEFVQTDGEGVAWLGEETGEAAAAFQELEGLSRLLSVGLPACSYTLRAELLDVDTLTVATEGTRDFEVQDLPTAFTFRGFSSLYAQGRSLVQLNVRLTTTVPADTLLRWRLLVETPEGLAVEGFQGFYDGSGMGLAAHPQWTDHWTTDASGAAWHGPEAGFTPAELGLQQPTGTDLYFSLQPPEGDYRLTLQLVRVEDSEVVAEGGVEFTVNP
jgi:hypothetical protein